MLLAIFTCDSIEVIVYQLIKYTYLFVVTEIAQISLI